MKAKARAKGRCGEERSAVDGDGEGRTRCAEWKGCSGEEAEVGGGWWSPPARRRGGGGDGGNGGGIGEEEDCSAGGSGRPRHIHGPNFFVGRPITARQNNWVLIPERAFMNGM